MTPPRIITIYAIFYRHAREKDGSLYVSGAGSVPKDWTLAEIADTYDAAIIYEEGMRQHYGSIAESTIQPVRIKRPPETPFDFARRQP